MPRAARRLLTPRGLQKLPPAAPVPSHQLAGGAVLVGLVQVALTIVRLHQSPQLPIQGNVGHIICREDQQVRCFLPPTNLLLGGNKTHQTDSPPAGCAPIHPSEPLLPPTRRAPHVCAPIPGEETSCWGPSGTPQHCLPTHLLKKA